MTTGTTTPEARKAAYEQAFIRLEEALQAEEAAKAEGSPDVIASAHSAVAEWKAEMARIRKAMKAEGDEEVVILRAPSCDTPYTRDCYGLEFRYGRAVAPRSLADHYVDILDGYHIERPE